MYKYISNLFMAKRGITVEIFIYLELKEKIKY